MRISTAGSKPSRACGRHARRAGFTLIELIVVVFLIGVGTAIAFAAFDRIALRRESALWPEEVAFQLKRLRAKSISSGTIVNAEVRVDGGALVWNDGGMERQLLALPAGYAFDVPSVLDSPQPEGLAPKPPSDSARIVFFPDGTVSEVRFFLLMPADRVMRFWLRGLTGKIQVDELVDKV